MKHKKCLNDNFIIQIRIMEKKWKENRMSGINEETISIIVGFSCIKNASLYNKIIMRKSIAKDNFKNLDFLCL